MAGPLSGLTIIELAGLGPGPFAAMMLADHGARVIRIERSGTIAVPNDPLLRSRQSIALDLRHERGREVVRRLAERGDGLIEGYRPGVMERLGLGPEVLREHNPRLVYGRVTGWGQHGPLSQEAGHDINYLALTGLLHGMGEPEGVPRPPMNLVADFAGGGMMLAFGMVAALLAVQKGGEGQVIDAAMSDGASLIGTLIYGMRAAGLWQDRRGSNLLDGGMPLYGCYECADGRFVALGAIEPKFQARLLRALELDGEDLFASLGDTSCWEQQRQRIGAVVRGRTRDAWVAHCQEFDCCVAPVLDMGEAPSHPHHVTRGSFAELDGVIQPMPAPRFSGAAAVSPRLPRFTGEDGAEILAELGYGPDEINDILESP